MPSRIATLPLSALLLAIAVGVASLVSTPVGAAKDDRDKPMIIEADKPGTVDLQRQVVVFNGNVVITQGTMRIQAERIELREHSDGFRSATALGGDGRRASFSQKRDGVDETVEGIADRIEYDQRGDSLRLVGNASVRRLRGGVLADEVAGSLITWDNRNELFSVTGGAVSPSNPTGRVRAMFTPQGPAAASAPAPSSAPASAAAPALKSTRSLGDKR